MLSCPTLFQQQAASSTLLSLPQKQSSSRHGCAATPKLSAAAAAEAVAAAAAVNTPPDARVTITVGGSARLSTYLKKLKIEFKNNKISWPAGWLAGWLPERQPAAATVWSIY
jgi:hypothetical protein